MKFAEAGSQRWLQIAVNRKPDVLLEALRVAGAVAASESVRWTSPLESEGCCEYRDHVALGKANIGSLPKRQLRQFWPPRGPVWDAIGITSDGCAIFVEAKAHIPEAASPGSKASPKSKALIEQSLGEARKFYAPKATADWTGLFYQYANRLSHHYFLRSVNDKRSVLIFLYFLNPPEMDGPKSECEWKGAIRLIHAALGLPKHLETHGVFEVFVDVSSLTAAVS